jgi:two-component system sensor histidine kinase KdpD
MNKQPMGALTALCVRRNASSDAFVTADAPSPARASFVARTRKWRAYLYSVAAVLACTAVARLASPHFAEANMIMVYLLGVLIVAIHFGRGPAVLAAVLSVAAFDYFFLPLHLALVADQAQYLITLAVMLTAALSTGTLMARIQRQAEKAHERERRTAALAALSRDLASLRGVPQLLAAAVQHISAVCATPVAVLLPDDAMRLVVQAAAPTAAPLGPVDQRAAQWAYEHRRLAGAGTGTLPGATALYLPLVGAQCTVGVLGVRPPQPHGPWPPEQIHFLDTLANQTAVAVERGLLVTEFERARRQIEGEKLRNTLLSSVSHDLRTPLAAIAGAASSLMEDTLGGEPVTRHALLQTIYEESSRLNRLVGNLLQMNRLESGTLVINKEWQPLEEVIGAALARLETQLAQRSVTTHLPPGLLMLPFDSVLVEQTLVNLLENAANYTSPHSAIEIGVEPGDGCVRVSVADDGAGLPPDELERVFAKFYRGPNARQPGGVGLGLAICRAIVEAHGGRIWAENRPGGGTCFTFTLPVDGLPLEPDGRLPAALDVPLPAAPLPT